MGGAHVLIPVRYVHRPISSRKIFRRQNGGYNKQHSEKIHDEQDTYTIPGTLFHTLSINNKKINIVVQESRFNVSIVITNTMDDASDNQTASDLPEGWTVTFDVSDAIFILVRI